MKILAALGPLAAEENASTGGFPLWLTPFLAILLLWVLAIRLLVWALLRRGKKR
ncbi:hypothetical protein [Actinoplanes sp. M2I2]|uniref:hypothetical protein n=1 Tax=Actinoplanes sp. M2I2 TaxID=1734444 RepID=UPI00202010DC|nr:hypothetical protein [Actinoplanes sp. M2I2]